MKLFNETPIGTYTGRLEVANPAATGHAKYLFTSPRQDGQGEVNFYKMILLNQGGLSSQIKGIITKVMASNTTWAKMIEADLDLGDQGSLIDNTTGVCSEGLEGRYVDLYLTPGNDLVKVSYTDANKQHQSYDTMTESVFLFKHEPVPSEQVKLQNRVKKLIAAGNPRYVIVPNMNMNDGSTEVPIIIP